MLRAVSGAFLGALAEGEVHSSRRGSGAPGHMTVVKTGVAGFTQKRRTFQSSFGQHVAGN